MILHCVFCNFRDDVPRAARFGVMQDLRDLCAGFDGVLGFDFGTNLDFEKKSQDHGEGFIIRFADRAAVDVYAGNARHKELGGQLCDLCVGGADGIIVYDLEV